MLKLAFFVCFVGFVVSQAPPPRNPFGFGMIPAGCDMTSLQQCLQPLMEQSAIMARQTDMSMGRFSPPNVDTVCRLVTDFKNCAMPKLALCGREIMMVANATVKAVNYMCVEARAKTEEYYQCMGRNPEAMTQMNECVSHFMVSQMEMASAIRSNSQPGRLDLWGMKTKLCSNMNKYEQCLENKAGYLCGDKSYVTKLFSLFNEGLRFLNCTNLGQNSSVNATARPFDIFKHFSHHNFSSHNFSSLGAMPGMPPILREMQCVGTHFQKCLGPLIMTANPSAASVERMCSMYQEYSRGCLSQLPSRCKTKARIAVHHLNKMVQYLCGEAKLEVEDSLSCYVREAPRIATSCMKPMMSSSMAGQKFVRTGRIDMIDKETEKTLCTAQVIMEECLSQSIERACGERASDILDPLFPMYSDMTDDLVGLNCRSYTDGHTDSYLPWCFGPRHHALKIILPIAAVLLLAIIIAVTVVICRRRRRRRNRQNLQRTESKSDLVKNDLLQQNLRFAITQTPKEKSDDALKISVA